MKKLIPILVLLAAAGGGGYYYYTTQQVVEPPQVSRATIAAGNITEQVQATGTLESIRLVQVGSQVSGVVQGIFADFNQIVRRGQLIAKIDPQLLQVQVDLQMANVARQEGEIAIQEVQLIDAIRNRDRTKQLFDKQLANATQVETADLTVKQRQTSLDSARKQLLTTQANLNQARLNVSYTDIFATIDGVVVNRFVDVGQTVQASMTTPQFFTIATDLRTLKLTAGVDEADIGKIRPDMRVLFTVESYPGVNFEGVVDAVRLNATNQNNVVTYPVWISVPNPDLRLRPSMTANVRIIIQTANNVVRIPSQALRFRPTNDMYTALGLTPPAQPQGGRLAGAGSNDAGPTANGGQGRRQGGATTAGAPTAAQPQVQAGRQGAGQAQPGSGRQPGGDAAQAGGGQDRGGQGQGQAGPGGQGRGGGRGADMANMTPEERQRMMDQFGARGGRGGQGQGGQGGGQGRGGQGGAQGGGRGGRGQQPANANVAPVELTAQTIDEMFAPMESRTTRGQVWTWDETKKELKSIPVVTGLTDGQFSQLISGEVKVGDQIVTNITIPLTAAQRAQQNQSIFGQQGGRGFGGPQPGVGGAGAFGAPGGGGGGQQRGGGGGGGGRGGF
jgi:HlyD family secretion protein